MLVISFFNQIKPNIDYIAITLKSIENPIHEAKFHVLSMEQPHRNKYGLYIALASILIYRNEYLLGYILDSLPL